MSKTKKFITALSITLIGMLFVFASVISATQAWFILSARNDPTWKSSSEGAYFAYGNGMPRPNPANPEVEDQPYGITRPIHLYNLAWLQYLGFFNEPDDNNASNIKQQCYFELGCDIDMTGWILPPIGTKENPFVGNFDGQGFKITNLTVSDTLTDYNRIPFGIDRNDFPTEMNILGLFGVVGKYENNAIVNYSSQTNEIKNVGISNLKIAPRASNILVGLAAGYVNGTISGVAVNNSNLDLSNSAAGAISGVSDKASEFSLIGHAKDVKYLAKLQSSTTAVDTPTVSNPLLSQGGNEWGGSIDMKSLYNVLAGKSHSASVYSGSYTYFEEYQRTKLNAGGYNPEDGYNKNNSKTQTTNYNFNYNFGIQNDSDHALYYYGKTDSTTDSEYGNVQTASYNFASKQTTAANTTSDGYIGLGGPISETDYTYTKRESTIEESATSGFLFYDTTSSLYLSAESTGLIATSQSAASCWFFDANSHLYTDGTGKIQYLNYTNNNLVLSDTGTSTWTWDSNSSALKCSNKYLMYNSSTNAWVMTNSLSQSYTYNIIKNATNNYYLAVANDNSTLTSTNNSANALHYYLETVNNQSYPYTIINGTKYYFQYYNNANRLTSTITDTTYYKINNTLVYRTTEPYSRWTLYYTYSLQINNGNTSRGSSYDWNSYPSGTNLSFTTYTSAQTTITMSRTSTNHNITTYEDTNETRHVFNETYFPLTWDDESQNMAPSNKNTGYVVGGSNYVDTDNPSIGDVRIAGGNNNNGQNNSTGGTKAYTTQRLKNSIIPTGTGNRATYTYANEKLYAYTFNSSGNVVRIGDPINGKMSGDSDYTSYQNLGLSKYYYSLLGRASGSRVALGNMLKNDNGTDTNYNIAYGLHFMNSDISTDNLINVPYALINGEKKINYDLPRDSIDFNLKFGGFINFFAATYYINPSSTMNNSTPSNQNKGSVTWNNSNNSFFSLHSIDRNDTTVDENDCTIDHIKQIAKIYKNTQYTGDDPDVPQYVYTYRNAAGTSEVSTSFDTGVRDSSGNLIVGSKGNLVFDTFLLTDPDYSKFNIYSLYYFEIPVNKGEFALGSTSGKTDTNRGWSQAYNKNGAYLLYLDIGASKKNNNAVTIDEKLTTTTCKYDYPIGVDFATIASTKDADGNYDETIFGGNSAAIIVPAGTNKNIAFNYTDRTTNTAALLEVGPTDSSGTYTATYMTIDTNAQKKDGTPIGIVASSSSVDVMEREILYDLTTTTNNYSISPVHTIDGDRGDTDTVTSTASWTEAQLNSIKVFEPEEAVNLFTVIYSKALNATESNLVVLDSSYDPLTYTYTITFGCAVADQDADIMFTALNLNQSYTETVGNTTTTTTYTYYLTVSNTNADTSAVVGSITNSNKDVPIIVICVVTTSS